MKLLNNNFAKSNLVIKIRNLLNIKPILQSLQGIKKSSSISDAFCWRTDKGYTTTFKYSDLLNLFYQKNNSFVKIHIYSKKNELLKKLKVENLDYSNQLIIDTKLLGGLEDYGVFYVYHTLEEKLDEKNDENFLISNRCYLGFSKNNNLNSFVHGNTLAKFQNLNGKRKNNDVDIVKTTLFSNNIYRIQNYFKDFSKTELFFANPTSKTLNILIGEKKYILKPRYSLIIDATEKNSIKFKSNCLLLRPIIFNYKNNYLDVYHS